MTQTPPPHTPMGGLFAGMPHPAPGVESSDTPTPRHAAADPRVHVGEHAPHPQADPQPEPTHPARSDMHTQPDVAPTPQPPSAPAPTPSPDAPQGGRHAAPEPQSPAPQPAPPAPGTDPAPAATPDPATPAPAPDPAPSATTPAAPHTPVSGDVTDTGVWRLTVVDTVLAPPGIDTSDITGTALPRLVLSAIVRHTRGGYVTPTHGVYESDPETGNVSPIFLDTYTAETLNPDVVAGLVGQLLGLPSWALEIHDPSGKRVTRRTALALTDVQATMSLYNAAQEYTRQIRDHMVRAVFAARDSGNGPTISQVAKHVGASRDSLYRWRKELEEE